MSNLNQHWGEEWPLGLEYWVQICSEGTQIWDPVRPPSVVRRKSPQCDDLQTTDVEHPSAPWTSGLLSIQQGRRPPRFPKVPGIPFPSKGTVNSMDMERTWLSQPMTLER